MGPLWSHLGSLGDTWGPIVPHWVLFGVPWGSMGCYGVLWGLMGCHGVLWGDSVVPAGCRSWCAAGTANIPGPNTSSGTTGTASTSASTPNPATSTCRPDIRSAPWGAHSPLWGVSVGLEGGSGVGGAPYGSGWGVLESPYGSDCGVEGSECLCGAHGKFGGRGGPIWVCLWGFGVSMWV